MAELKSYKHEDSSCKIRRHLFIAIALMLLAGVFTKYFMFPEIKLPERPLNGFPQKIGVWETINSNKLNQEVLNILKVNDYLFRDFIYKNQTLSLYIGYYSSHREFAEIHTPEHCQAGGGWEMISQKKKRMNINGSKDHLINFIEAVYEKNNEKQLFLYWYQLNGKYITNFFHYKLNVILNSLIHHRSDALFVRISIPIENKDIREVIQLEEKFLTDFVPVINTFFQN